MDEKEEDKTEESLRKHIIFYEKLNQKILDMQEEIKISSDKKTLKHLKERIDALELDKERIRKLFPQTSDETWNHSN